MNEIQKQIARHALGLPNKNKKSYRNGYATYASMSQYLEWSDMVAKGLAVQSKQPVPTSGIITFHLTEAGALLALESGETLDPEDFE